MEPIVNKKNEKFKTKNYSHSTIRVKETTQKKLLDVVERINQKDFGKNVRCDELISLALDLVRPEHISKLQNASLSNQERMDRAYKAHVEKHGPISKDRYLGLVMSGALSAPHSEGVSE